MISSSSLSSLSSLSSSLAIDYKQWLVAKKLKAQTLKTLHGENNSSIRSNSYHDRRNEYETLNILERYILACLNSQPENTSNGMCSYIKYIYSDNNNNDADDEKALKKTTETHEERFLNFSKILSNTAEYCKAVGELQSKKIKTWQEISSGWLACLFDECVCSSRYYADHHHRHIITKLPQLLKSRSKRRSSSLSTHDAKENSVNGCSFSSSSSYSSSSHNNNTNTFEVTLSDIADIPPTLNDNHGDRRQCWQICLNNGEFVFDIRPSTVSHVMRLSEKKSLEQTILLLTKAALRYESLLSGGQQWGLSLKHAALLYTHFGVRNIGFASIWNFQLSGYDSVRFGTLFPDTDKCAGGVGTFCSIPLHLYPGNWFVNPPFTEKILFTAASHVLKCLDSAVETDAKNTITSIGNCTGTVMGMDVHFFGPHWKSSEYLTALTSSRYYCFHLVLKPKTYWLMKPNGEHFVASTESVYIVLSNNGADNETARTKQKLKLENALFI